MNRFYKILKIICSLIFIFSFAHKTIFAAQVVTPMDIYNGTPVQYDNQYLTLYTRQYDLQGEFCSRLLAVKNDPSALPFVERFAQVIGDLGRQNKFVYLVKAPDSNTFYAWYTGFKDAYTPTINQYVKVGEYIYNYCPVITGPVYKFAYWDNTGIVSNNTVQSTMTIPYAMTNVFNPAFIDVFKAFGIYETDFESDLRELLENIAQNSSANYNSALETINNSINDQTDTLHSDLTDMTNTLEGTNDKIDETNDNLNDIQNTLQDTNDFLQSTDVDEDNYDLPTEDTQDITQDGIDNIFTVIQEAFLRESPRTVSIQIPFTNKYMYIEGVYVENYLRYHTKGTGLLIINLVRAFYWYLISRFIIGDISKKIKNIKSGNLENIQNDNIKEEML